MFNVFYCFSKFYFVVVCGEGVFFYDDVGCCYFDGFLGVFVVNIGYGCVEVGECMVV